MALSGLALLERLPRMARLSNKGLFVWLKIEFADNIYPDSTRLSSRSPPSSLNNTARIFKREARPIRCQQLAIAINIRIATQNMRKYRRAASHVTEHEQISSLLKQDMRF